MPGNDDFRVGLDGNGLDAVLTAEKIRRHNPVRPEREIEAEIGVVTNYGEVIVAADAGVAAEDYLPVRLDRDGGSGIVDPDRRGDDTGLRNALARDANHHEGSGHSEQTYSGTSKIGSVRHESGKAVARTMP